MRKEGGVRFGRTLARAVAACALTSTIASAQPAPPRPDQTAFRALYKELVETNTTFSAGSCTLAAQRMAARLRAAGYPDRDLHLLIPPEQPKAGNLVAVLPGTDPNAKAVLLLAHLDVVEAKRADWTRDPFTLVEENGTFYARGVFDDKAQGAIWVDTLIRLRQEATKPRRTVKMALTCGEEGGGFTNGAEWLVKTQRPLMDTGFALNEGGGGKLDVSGRPQMLGVQIGEKLSQNFTLEVTNPGGHSSRPMPDNAIYQLSAGLMRIGAHRFPVMFTDSTRTMFTRMASVMPNEDGAAMQALIKNPRDETARARLERSPDYGNVLHTTCVATTFEAGHAQNALPQRATANVNCRIFPGVSVEETQAVLQRVVADPAIKINVRETRNAAAPPPPLDPAVIGPAEKIAAEMWPGVPQSPMLLAAATDGAHLIPAGIPTYGISGLFIDADGGGLHGLNEHIRVKSLYDGRDYLYRLVKTYVN